MKIDIRVCHLTSAHPAADVRIFIKQCSSLASEGYETHLVAPGSSQNVSGVTIHGIPQNRKGRFTRMTRTVWNVFKKAKEIDADLYHFHDIELIFIGSLLKRKGKKVIYDVHEDTPRSLITRDYLPRPILFLISCLLERIENLLAKQFDGIITATPYIRDRFKKTGCKAVDINNYPILAELYDPKKENVEKQQWLAYVGAICKERGIVEMVRSIGETTGRLQLAGSFSPRSHRDLVVSTPGWDCVDELGQIERKEVAKLLLKSMAGIVIFHPEPNHVNAQPNKIFEYMSAGIPVIASDFPLWKAIIEENEAGICVDPENPREIGKAIQWIFENPEKAHEMGMNGRKAVEQKYNWDMERNRLFSIYENILG